jgi:hypothetical protein
MKMDEITQDELRRNIFYTNNFALRRENCRALTCKRIPRRLVRKRRILRSEGNSNVQIE